MEGYKCSLAQRKWGVEVEGVEEWYGLTGVAMGTLLLKAGRVSVEWSVRQERRMPPRGLSVNCTNSTKAQYFSRFVSLNMHIEELVGGGGALDLPLPLC